MKIRAKCEWIYLDEKVNKQNRSTEECSKSKGPEDVPGSLL